MSHDTDVTYYLSNLIGKSLLSDASFEHILNNILNKRYQVSDMLLDMLCILTL